MRVAILVSVLALVVMLGAASAQDRAKPKARPSLADDARALQGTWDRPPNKGADGKVTRGLRLEVRGRQITVLVYEKVGDPRGGSVREVGRPFALKEKGGKRLIVEGLDDVPIFTYALEGDRLTVTSEKWLVHQLGKEWKMPDRNLLKKVPNKK